VCRAIFPVFSAVLFCLQVAAPEGSDPVTQALSQGDLYASKRKYELAVDAYTEGAVVGSPASWEGT
jgi:hypothetical protein